MSIVETLALLTVGVVIGLVVGLVLFMKKNRIPKPVPVDKLDAWKHLEELAKKRAEVRAKRKALQEALSKGSIDEKTYVEESARIDAEEDTLENEFRDTMYLIAKGLVPEFMLDTRNELVKLEEAIKLSQMAKRLKKELEDVKSERDSLYMKINELEDEKKEVLAKYNWLEANSTKRLSEMQETLDDLKSKIDILKRENTELKESLKESGTPRDEQIRNMKMENKLIKEELETTKKKLNNLAKELGVLKTLVERYANVIKDKETKTLEEMKNLVAPKDENVRDLIKTYANPVRAYEYVRDKITEIEPPTSFSFWLDVGDIVKIGAGDNNDRAILLCSMLRALGKDARVLLVETTKGENRALVLLNDNGVYYLLDLDKTRKFTDFSGRSRDEVLNKYSTSHGGIAKVLYEFNDEIAKAMD